MTGKQLKNSILQWAIQGKLVPQDPNDEPASVLLEKIRQEKERLIKEKKIKRDKNASVIYRGEDNSYYEKILATGEVKCIDKEIPFEIPQGWEWCRVSSLFQINPKVVAEDNTSAAFIPMEAISAGYGSEFRYYEKKWGEIKSGYTAFADNDIAFAKITPCFQNRKSAIFEGLPNGIGAGTTELKILRTYGETINHWFVLYFLESPYFIDEATFKGTANQQRIIVGYLENKLFPLPPLAEQKRIVDKIGLVMPIIDKYSKAQELLDKMNVELNECLKKSVLQEAIQGKLVPQIAEEGTAQELLEQIKAEKQKLVKEGKLKKSALNDSVIFKGDDNKYYERINKEVVEIELPCDYPNSWCVVRLKDVCQLIDGVKMSGKGICLDAKYLRGKSSPTYLDKGRFVRVNDSIILVDGENSGEVFIVPQDGYMGSTFKQLWISSSMYEPYVLAFIQFYKETLRNSKKGAAIPHLNKELFYGLIIGIPPLQEQRRIVQKIEQLMQLLK
ncbi:MAG: restriction endonuclease subunit S [Muribaculaceae bacterium]|nr:restriction endonuclease subunit S [Muribaculaceae bacterium]